MKTRIIHLLNRLYHSPRLRSGQAIVLIGAASIGLIAMMGLAIDGGRLLFLQRDVQNAADAAAIAAARALCTARDPEPFALAAAAENGFDNNGTSNWVTVNSPPVGASFEIKDVCEGCYTEVEIKAEIPPTFIGIVYGGELSITAHAIGACNPDLDAADNAAPDLRAVWAMSDSCPSNPVEITGSEITIIGGGHSNGTMKIMPKTGGGSVSGPTSYVEGDGVQDNGKVNYDEDEEGSGIGDGETFTGSCLSTCFTGEDAGGADEEGYPAQNPYKTDPKTEYPLDHDIADFAPGGTQAILAAAKGEYYEYECGKGKFYNWLLDNHVTGTVMDNGIYYAACDIKIDKIDDVTGNVTVVSTGEIDVSGDSQNWAAYTEDLLLFTTVNTGCGSAIKFAGNDNQWAGNIFAPYGAIEMSASSNHTDTKGCLVGQQIKLAGSNNTVTCEISTGEDEKNPGIWLSE